VAEAVTSGAPSIGPASRPSLSVCVPLYRPEPRYVSRLVDSLAAQEVPELEVVMVDDASPGLDASALESMLGPLSATVPLTWSRNSSNLGMVGNWNRSVGAGHGELTMLVSQDDELGPGMLAAYIAEFVFDPDVVLVSSAEQFIDAESRPFERKLNVGHRHNVFVHRDRYLIEHAELVRLSLRNGQGFGEPSAVMFRRSVFEAIDGYDESFEHSADVDFNLRASAHGRSVYLRRPYLRRRWHAGGLTHANVSSGAVARDRLRLYQRFANTPGLSDLDRARARSSLALHSLYDAMRAARARQWGVVRLALGNLRSGWWAPPRVHATHLREIARHHNLDER
jgi:GT2 family glycosyltransferase